MFSSVQLAELNISLRSSRQLCADQVWNRASCIVFSSRLSAQIKFIIHVQCLSTVFGRMLVIECVFILARLSCWLLPIVFISPFLCVHRPEGSCDWLPCCGTMPACPWSEYSQSPWFIQPDWQVCNLKGGQKGVTVFSSWHYSGTHYLKPLNTCILPGFIILKDPESLMFSKVFLI